LAKACKEWNKKVNEYKRMIKDGHEAIKKPYPINPGEPSPPSDPNDKRILPGGRPIVALMDQIGKTRDHEFPKRNSSNVETEEKKVDIEDVNDDKEENCKTLVGGDEVFEDDLDIALRYLPT
ncbi:16156_t:CDS:2, partial [Racocetra fulgida]